MVLEMKKALNVLKNGDRQGYRKIYDATCEEVYCRSYLILQDEEQAQEFTKDFYVELFGVLDEADEASDMEKWFWKNYYQTLRKQYHKLLEKQTKKTGVRTLAELPGSLPLLHRIMAVMHAKDDFSAREISAIYGLPAEKVDAELEKLDAVLPKLTKGQSESVAAYLGSWNTLFLGASKQIVSTCMLDWDGIYKAVAAEAGIAADPAIRKDETFEYFVADVDLAAVQASKKAAPLVEEDDEYDDDEYDDDDDEYDDDEYDDDEYDEDDEDDDRYDWDLEDDGRKMVILGIILALVILAVVGFGVSKLIGNNDKKEQMQTEQEAEEGDAELIIKGDAPGEEEPEETEPVEEEPEEEPEEEEPEVMKMRVTGNNINIRKEANTNCDVLTQVNEGEEVEVLSDPAQEWVQIRCIEQDDEEGYMKSEYLDAIE